MKIINLSILVIALSLVMSSCSTKTQINDNSVISLYCKSIVIPNITYLETDSIDLQLDAYVPAQNLGGEPWVEFTPELKPVLLYIHGGGWQGLNRAVRNLNIMPYIDKGYAVVNIDYRLLDQAPFPACIADCRYALNWIYENAAQYKFDTTSIVVSGESAGGHLALMMGFLKDDNEIFIPGKRISRKLHVSAVINWFGVSDMKKLAGYWNSPEFNRKLSGDTTRQEFIYSLCSPLSYINPDCPPVLTIHGNQDKTIPFDQAVELHEKLDKQHVKNKLHVLNGKSHGDFDEKEMSECFSEIWKFLDEVWKNEN
jgi:acetyl esterase/lipase